MIAIIDYGAGNLRSVQNALCEIGAACAVFSSPAGLESARAIVLPGVGHFGQMMRALDARQLRAPLLAHARAGTPLLGICLGLQALFEASEEAPRARGLGLLPGRIRRFPAAARVPHMGWNAVEVRAPSRLLPQAGDRPFLYFAHSYYAPPCEATTVVAHYAVPFTAALEAGNLAGVQFHPEKSGPAGLALLRNFVASC